MVALARNLLLWVIEKGLPDVTFIVRGTRSDDATTAIRLRADTAVAKARDLIGEGWLVFIECPAGIQNCPGDFDNLLSDPQDDRVVSPAIQPPRPRTRF